MLAYGTMVHVAEAAVKMARVDAEIIDVRTIAPLDVDTLCTSVCKTGRCVVAHEATRFGGFGAELVATVQEQCFWNLEAPIQRVAAGTRLTHTPSSGSISRDRRASPRP